MTAQNLNELATMWSERLGVGIRHVQVRAMRNKWASCSTNGTLTLSAASRARSQKIASGMRRVKATKLHNHLTQGGWASLASPVTRRG
ncbi:MAG: YgjP-like metallopeptidase domain-containing protein [Anaerolineae bacterium]